MVKRSVMIVAMSMAACCGTLPAGTGESPEFGGPYLRPEPGNVSASLDPAMSRWGGVVLDVSGGEAGTVLGVYAGERGELYDLRGGEQSIALTWLRIDGGMMRSGVPFVLVLDGATLAEFALYHFDGLESGGFRLAVELGE